jgi:hypothetical protein
VDLISTAKNDASGANLLSDMDSLERSVVLIQEMLDTIANYVSQVQVWHGRRLIHSSVNDLSFAMSI